VVAGLSGLTLLVAGCGGGGSSSAGSSSKKLVYFMAPNTTPTRYIQQDGPDFKKALEKLDPSIEVKFVNAGGSSDTQLSQANSAIAAGAKALVVVAADPNTSAGLLQAAQQANIPVIGYENPPIKGAMYAQVVFDAKSVGAQQATYFAAQVKSGALGSIPVKVARLYGNKGDVYTSDMLAGQNQVLDPLIKDGSINVVCQDYVKNWAPDAAQTATEQCLTKTQNKIDAFLGFYDGITAGTIAALKGKNVSIPVYGGQNPELTGLQYMLTGDQQDDVLKAFSVEAAAAAKITLAAIQKQQPPSDLVKDSVNNGAGAVPTAKLPSTYIHLEKGVDPGTVVQKAVDLGMFTWKQICTGPASSTATCKTKVG
jgi:ABC-type xylose transport system substrate-binding protein